MKSLPVDKKGVVTAVAEGTTTIFALYREGEDNNSAVSATYQVTVSKTATTSKDDVLALSATTVNTNAGLFVESAVKAPAVTVKNGTTDVTEAYNITYLWTDASKKELGKDATLLLQPTTQADLLLTWHRHRRQQDRLHPILTAPVLTASRSTPAPAWAGSTPWPRGP